MPTNETQTDPDERSKKALDIAVDTRKLEVTLFWQRSLFFWGFIGAAFVAYATLLKDTDKEPAFVVSCFGLICALAWTLANRGSKYWQEAWEQKVAALQEAVLGQALFSREEETQPKGPWGAKRYSVSRLTIALSDFVVLIWAGLAWKAFPGARLLAIVVLIVTAGWIVAMFVFTARRQAN